MTPRTITTAGELHALAPGSIIRETTAGLDPDLNTMTAYQKRADGQWVGGFTVETAERMVASRPTEHFPAGWSAQVLYEATETRSPEEIVEVMAPACMALLRQYFQDQRPGLQVTIRRSKVSHPMGYDVPPEPRVNVTFDPAGVGVGAHAVARLTEEIAHDVRTIGEGVGIPGMYLVVRHKRAQKAVTAAGVRKIVKGMGWRTIADAYHRAKGYGYVQITQEDDERVGVRVNLTPDLERDSAQSVRAAEGITEELTNAGYTVTADGGPCHLIVSKPAPAAEEGEGDG